jgi:hypothetical protein
MKAQETMAAPIDVEEAVRLAKQFASKIYESEKISRLGLEAVERTDDGKYWLVTLGFSRPWSFAETRDSVSPLDKVLPRLEKEPKREYKVFNVDAHSGVVTGIDRTED